MWIEKLAERQRGIGQVWAANASGWRRMCLLLLFVLLAPPAVWVFNRAIAAGAIYNPNRTSDDPEPTETDETGDDSGGDVIAVQFARAA